MTLYLSESGLVYGGDRQIRDDGSFDPILPERPSTDHIWNGSEWLPNYKPNWLKFNSEMMVNDSYNELLVDANPIIIGRIETMFITGNENWEMLKVIWNSFVQSITMNLNIEEIESMNEIAKNAYMPFEFNEHCQMVLK